jgi:hypothetical protein
LKQGSGSSSRVVGACLVHVAAGCRACTSVIVSSRRSKTICQKRASSCTCSYR